LIWFSIDAHALIHYSALIIALSILRRGAILPTFTAASRFTHFNVSRSLLRSTAYIFYYASSIRLPSYSPPLRSRRKIKMDNFCANIGECRFSMQVSTKTTGILIAKF